jgi:hypothetical protein
MMIVYTLPSCVSIVWPGMGVVPWPMGAVVRVFLLGSFFEKNAQILGSVKTGQRSGGLRASPFDYFT